MALKESIRDLAVKYDVEEAAALAVTEVEKGPNPTVWRNWPLMRLEVHVLWREFKARGLGTDLVDELFFVDGPKPWEGHRVLLHRIPRGAQVLTDLGKVEIDGKEHQWVRMHSGTLRTARNVEIAAFKVALDLAKRASDPDLAEETCYWSTSWGAFQLMGWHHELAGYDSAYEMARAFRMDWEQAKGFFKMIAARDSKYVPDKKLIDFLRAKDWRAFTRDFNGPGQVDWYSERIQHVYEKLTAG